MIIYVVQAGIQEFSSWGGPTPSEKFLTGQKKGGGGEGRRRRLQYLFCFSMVIIQL